MSKRVMLMLLISFSFHTGAGIDDPANRHGTTGIRRKLLTSLVFGVGPGVTTLGSNHIGPGVTTLGSKCSFAR